MDEMEIFETVERSIRETNRTDVTISFITLKSTLTIT
jgi:hypothetical protein